MGSINDTLILWIDKNVNTTDENKKYQKTIKSYKGIDLECKTNVQEGINYIKKIKFRKTIIILSGWLFSEFCKELKNCLSVGLCHAEKVELNKTLNEFKDLLREMLK